MLMFLSNEEKSQVWQHLWFHKNDLEVSWLQINVTELPYYCGHLSPRDGNSDIPSAKLMLQEVLHPCQKCLTSICVVVSSYLHHDFRRTLLHDWVISCSFNAIFPYSDKLEPGNRRSYIVGTEKGHKHHPSIFYFWETGWMIGIRRAKAIVKMKRAMSIKSAF